MINFNRQELEDKIYACWIGKNIGGTFGGPYEGRRHVLDVTDFATKSGKPLPNDDLDLQLVWLMAYEDCGPKMLTERVLGEYWLERIPPYWNEYGVCKSNMTRGLLPPLSGEFENEWKHSNGAWIRTEIWACLYPGLVEDAIRFAYMDACVDHGMGEGTFAAIFVAAMESAAFVINDIRTLLNIGLSKIPETCRMYQAITAAIKAFDEGKTWQEAREIVTKMALDDPELGWFQAPANVSYAVIGLLYGQGDFKKTMSIAVSCGDDTDCTGATVGALMGLMNGMAAIPEDWRAHIGDEIVTVALNRGASWGVPNTCTELAQRVFRQHAISLLGKPVSISDAPSSYEEKDVTAFSGHDFADELAKRSPYHFDMEFAISRIMVDYDRAPRVEAGGEIGVKVTVCNKLRAQKHFEISFLLPDGWTVNGGPKDVSVKYYGRTAGEFVLHAPADPAGKTRGVIQIACEGHPDTALIPLIFFA